MIIRLLFFIFVGVLLSAVACQNSSKPQIGLDLDPVMELARYDRHAVKQIEPRLDWLLNDNHIEVEIPTLDLTAHCFSWGGELGGPWTRILCFYKGKPIVFQRQFLFKGEYPMSIMGGGTPPCQNGDKHPLGDQLTELARELGPEVYLNPEKMKDLLQFTMTSLLGCERIRRGFMDSLDLDNTKSRNDLHLDFKFIRKKEFLSTIQRVKQEITMNPDPNVLFFWGELINGIWKGTVRQYDHTGRYCVELDYLNGKYAYTLWL